MDNSNNYYLNLTRLEEQCVSFCDLLQEIRYFSHDSEVVNFATMAQNYIFKMSEKVVHNLDVKEFTGAVTIEDNPALHSIFWGLDN